MRKWILALTGVWAPIGKRESNHWCLHAWFANIQSLTNIFYKGRQSRHSERWTRSITDLLDQMWYFHLWSLLALAHRHSDKCYCTVIHRPKNVLMVYDTIPLQLLQVDHFSCYLIVLVLLSLPFLFHCSCQPIIGTGIAHWHLCQCYTMDIDLTFSLVFPFLVGVFLPAASALPFLLFVDRPHISSSIGVAGQWHVLSWNIVNFIPHFKKSRIPIKSSETCTFLQKYWRYRSRTCLYWCSTLLLKIVLIRE